MNDILVFVQILFYLTVAVVTVLTYLSAKKGLLNPINTEYHKKVIERLKEVSEEMISEFDSNSPNCWINESTIEDFIIEINRDFRENKELILRRREFGGGRPVTKTEERLMSFYDKIQSDPFIPKVIRDKFKEHLETRINTIHVIYTEEIDRYKKFLAEGNDLDPNDESKYSVHNAINDRLYEQNCGIGQIEEQINQLRESIQEYFNVFNPIK